MSSPQESIRDKVERTKNGKPRALRPDGSYYDKDPKTRHTQLVEDGKVGGKGSELAREHGRMGGRPRNVSAREFVAQRAREEADRIYAALAAGLDSESAKQRRDSATAILDVEKDHLRARERQEANREKVDKDAIITMLVERLTGGTAAAKILRSRMEAVDADAFEDAELPAGRPD